MKASVGPTHANEFRRQATPTVKYRYNCEQTTETDGTTDQERE